MWTSKLRNYLSWKEQHSDAPHYFSRWFNHSFLCFRADNSKFKSVGQIFNLLVPGTNFLPLLWVCHAMSLILGHRNEGIIESFNCDMCSRELLSVMEKWLVLATGASSHCELGILRLSKSNHCHTCCTGCWKRDYFCTTVLFPARFVTLFAMIWLGGQAFFFGGNVYTSYTSMYHYTKYQFYMAVMLCGARTEAALQYGALSSAWIRTGCFKSMGKEWGQGLPIIIIIIIIIIIVFIHLQLAVELCTLWS